MAQTTESVLEEREPPGRVGREAEASASSVMPGASDDGPEGVDGGPADAEFMEYDRPRSARHENFPVGSWLIAPDLRPHVMCFYDFARAADDVADDPHLSPAGKLAQLDAFEAALRGEDGPPVAKALRDSLRQTSVSGRHARDLLVAFRRDAEHGRCQTWAELAEYCSFSAHPVGRYLLDLHGERSSAYTASDALCAALQVLNHLQDLREDYVRLDRVYLPLDWMAAAGVEVSDLAPPRSTPALTAVRHRTLDAVDVWLHCARALPRRLRSRRLASEAASIVSLAHRLSVKLRRSDPLAGRVAPTRTDFAVAGMAGATRLLRHRRRRR